MTSHGRGYVWLLELGVIQFTPGCIWQSSMAPQGMGAHPEPTQRTHWRVEGF